ncbi:MAG: alkaline phosphatase family protein [Terriglobales bacterium]
MKQFLFALVAVVALAAFSFAQVPASNHVVLVVEENHSYSSVIGNSSMPYLNSLASKYGLATQYYGNTHPSIGNYFMMTTGQILTNDDNQTPSSFPVSADNFVRHLIAAGKTWKSYAEGLPSIGYTGGNTGYYIVRHNPFPYFTDVLNSSTQKLNLVPFTQFAVDLANNQLPNFSYIVPNVMNDAHNGSLAQADTWLQQNIAPLLANPAFQQDGILIITFDESFDTDTAHGGGQIPTVVIGPKAKLGYQSNTFYQHQNLLRTMLTALGVTTFPGAGATATSMADFFTTTPTLPPASPSFQLTVSPATAVAQMGSPVTIAVMVTPQNGFADTVSLSYSGMPAGASATWSTTTLRPAGGSATANLTITMNSASAALSPARQRDATPFFALSLPFVGLAVGTVLVGDRCKKSRLGFWIVLGLVLALAAICTGCGSAGNTASTQAAQNGAAAHSYTVTITGTSGTLQQSASVVLTAQQ